MSSYILALDFDWQGTTAAVFDDSLRQVASAFEESSILSPNPGEAVQEPEDIVGSAERTIRRVTDDSGIAAADIKAVGLGGQMGGLLGIGKDGKAMTVYMTRMDKRPQSCRDQMRAKEGQKILELTGGPAAPQGAQILWWKHADEHAYFKIAKFVTAYAYVGMQMCGLSADEAFYDYTGLAHSGFGDTERKTWSPELLRAFDLSEDKLPKIVAPTDIIGEVSAEFAKGSGLAEGTKVIAGSGNPVAALFGAGITKPGTVAQFNGSLSLVAGVSKDHKKDAAGVPLFAMHTPVGNDWYIVACTAGSGIAERWFKDTLTGEDESSYKELDAEAANVVPGSDGVFFVPHFAHSSSAAKGAFVGLDWHATRAFLYRAVMEGVAYQKSLAIAGMRKVYPDLEYTCMAAIDAAERPALANQIEADVLGMRVVPMETVHPALIGIAAIAAQGSGLTDDAAAILPAPQCGEARDCDAKTHEVYEGCVKAYSELTGILDTFRPNQG